VSAAPFFPILVTRDLRGLLGFYRDLLGFSVAYAFPDEGEPVYVGLELGPSELGIAHDPELTDGPSARFSLWLYVDDCDATVERLRAAAVTVVEEPADQPFGERIARVVDPDGNMVIVGRR
jgi:lactoylglutathione lyase